MKVLTLAETIGAICGIPVPTAQIVARYGRDNDILTSRGRGRNAAEAISLDAAFLTIPMMVAPSPGMSARYMADFGSLRSVSLFETVPEDAEFLRERFPPQHTFAYGLAQLFSALGDKEFVAQMWPLLQADSHDPIDTEIVIRETELSASLVVGPASFTYEHASLAHVDTGKLFRSEMAADMKEQQVKLEVVNKITADAKALYVRPVKMCATIESPEIVEIAAAVNGVSFRDLVAAFAAELQSEGI